MFYSHNYLNVLSISLAAQFRPVNNSLTILTLISISSNSTDEYNILVHSPVTVCTYLCYVLNQHSHESIDKAWSSVMFDV